MATLKTNSPHLPRKQSRKHLRLILFIAFVLGVLFTSFYVVKQAHKSHKASKEAKSDIKKLEHRLEESQYEIKVLTSAMENYKTTIAQLREDFNLLKRQQVQAPQGKQDESFTTQTNKKLDLHEARLDSLSAHVMVIMQDIEDIGSRAHGEDMKVTQQNVEPTITQEGKNDDMKESAFSRWKKDLSEIVKESLAGGKDMTNRIVEKTKETTKVMGQKVAETGSMVKEGIYNGAKKTKEFMTRQGEEMSTTVSGAKNSFSEKMRDLSGKAQEQTKKVTEGVKNQAKMLVKKVKDIKDSFMKMFR